MSAKSIAKLFYGLLVLSGLAFSITACAYGMMAFRLARAVPEDASDDPGSATAHPLVAFLDAKGASLMAIELAVLALATVAAIGVDRYTQIAQRRETANPATPTHRETTV